MQPATQQDIDNFIQHSEPQLCDCNGELVLSIEHYPLNFIYPLTVDFETYFDFFTPNGVNFKQQKLYKK